MLKKTKEDILEESLILKRNNEEILDVFRKKYGKQGRECWFLKVKCLKHNYIYKTSYSNFKKYGCKKCGIEKIKEKNTLSKDFVENEFINNLKNNDELIELYQKKNNSNKKQWYAKIKCEKHGIFETTKNNYIDNGYGCWECGIEKRAKKLTLSEKQVIQDFNNHLKTNESLIKVYRKKNSKNQNVWWGTLKCSTHGKFEISKNHHKSGRGCPQCGEERVIKSKTLSIKQATKDFKEQLKPTEKLIKVYQKNIRGLNKWYAIIECDKHGNFEISKGDHKQGKGCQKCSASKGENKIRQYLLNNKINHEEQYKFKDCRNINSLPFDFYIPSLNMVIEYNGEQHYRPVEYFGGEEVFKIQQKRDKIKKEYCKNNNIKLLEIPYTEYNNIERILDNETKYIF